MSSPSNQPCSRVPAPYFSGVVATDKAGCIGKDGKLPWNCKEDMLFFKTLTEGCTVIMGRKTWDSLPKKPLQNRLNIILTRDPSTVQSESELCLAMTVDGFSRFITSGPRNDYGTRYYVIGGLQVYQLFRPLLGSFYVTHVDTLVEGGDTFLPVDFFEGFKEVSSTPLSSRCVSKFLMPKSAPVDFYEWKEGKMA